MSRSIISPLSLIQPDLLCRCDSWVDRPAVLFQISNHENFFHYLNDGFMGVLETLTETKLLPDRLARRALVQPHFGAKMSANNYTNCRVSTCTTEGW